MNSIIETRRQVNEIFLKRLNGTRIAIAKGPNSFLEWWQIKGYLVIVQLWSDGGWEYYLQGGGGRAADIVQDIEEYFQMTFGTKPKEA
jgi:hypothetical protein